MVSDHYIQKITDYSKKELSLVLSSVEEPSTLIGGWAVYFHVHDDFMDRHARDYIGSRDIDLGVHVDPNLGKDELENSPVGITLKSIVSPELVVTVLVEHCRVDLVFWDGSAVVDGLFV